MSPDAHPSKRAPGFDTYYSLNEPPIGTLIPKELAPQNERVPKLFEPLRIRGVTFKNRIWVSPMCQYSSDDGAATDWHLVHIGAFAVRGAGAITMEATAVVPEGRITPHDAGIWAEKHIAPLKRIVNFAHIEDTPIGIQLAHAGRKASTRVPWTHNNVIGESVVPDGIAHEDEEGWPDNVWSASDIPFSEDYPKPKALTLEGIEKVKTAFKDAVKRCIEIGFDFIEIHGAHGYLLHNFVSPLSNNRKDKYGGSFENRIRLSLEIAQIVREEWPVEKPLFYRVSATDWAEGPEKDDSGKWKQWGIEQTIKLATELQKVGVDLVDCSTGGNWVKQKIPICPGYQVPFAAQLKAALPNLPVSSVGLIFDPHQAEGYLQDGKSDVIMLARELLRRADWPLYAAQELGVALRPAVQYERAWSRMLKPRRAGFE